MGKLKYFLGRGITPPQSPPHCGGGNPLPSPHPTAVGETPSPDPTPFGAHGASTIAP